LKCFARDTWVLGINPTQIGPLLAFRRPFQASPSARVTAIPCFEPHLISFAVFISRPWVFLGRASEEMELHHLTGASARKHELQHPNGRAPMQGYRCYGFTPVLFQARSPLRAMFFRQGQGAASVRNEPEISTSIVEAVYSIWGPLHVEKWPYRTFSPFHVKLYVTLYGRKSSSQTRCRSYDFEKHCLRAYLER
jgi:hypothetical protein